MATTLNTIFDFTPNKDARNSRYILRQNKVSGSFILGQSEQPNDKIDDIPDTVSPTLVIKKAKSLEAEYLAPTRDGILSYKISAYIRLNRFPTKTFEQDINKLIGRNQISDEDNIVQVTQYEVRKRRTDLLAFYYGEYYEEREDGIKEKGTKGSLIVENQIGKIEFGAMAPKSRTKEFAGKFSPFSFCAYLDFPKQSFRTSIYTDFKFNLGVSYKVDLVIEFDKEKKTTILKMFINNIQQSIAFFEGKVWKKHKDNSIATRPGFKQLNPSFKITKEEEANAKEEGREPIAVESIIESKSSIIFDIDKLNLSQLYKIVGSPINKFSDRKLTSKDLPSLNNGVDFGSINIYNGIDDSTE
jgi:hypothetical protein